MTEPTPRMRYPKWMNDALASDLNATLEAREAAAREQQQHATDAAQGWLTNYSRDLIQQFTEHYAAQNRAFDKARGVDPDNRPTRYVEQPRDPAWITARNHFKEQWNALIEEGLDHDYLTALRGDEAPEYVINDDTTEWVEEPNPDYDPDKPNPYATLKAAQSITIPRAEDV